MRPAARCLLAWAFASETLELDSCGAACGLRQARQMNLTGRETHKFWVSLLFIPFGRFKTGIPADGKVVESGYRVPFQSGFSMKRLIASIAVLLGAAAASYAAPPAPLTTLHQVVSLSRAEADRGLPVEFEATVTCDQPDIYTLFVQEGGEGVYIAPPAHLQLVLGDRVLIRGKTQGSVRPIVIGESITLLHHGKPPEPLPATYEELLHLQRDCLLVTLRGVVRTADQKPFAGINESDLMLLTPGGYVSVTAGSISSQELTGMLDAEVEVTGVAGGLFDGKMQNHGVHLSVSSSSGIKILKRATTDPWTLPITPMDQIIVGYHVADHSSRIRVHGTITYYRPGISVVLQDDAKSLWIATRAHDPMQIGDIADAIGFPEEHNGFLALTRAEVKDTGQRAPVEPFATTRKELTTSRHIIDLVSVEGQVVTAARGGMQDNYELTADGQLFAAVYRHPLDGPILPMKPIPVGSWVRVSGICITEDSNPFNSNVGFDILMRDFNDITVVAKPSRSTRTI